MNKSREGILWVLVVASLIMGVYIITNWPAEQKEQVTSLNKTGYVDLPIVFEKFEMKIEIEKKLTKDLSSKKVILDSLKFQLQTLNNTLENQPEPSQEDAMKFQQMQNQYMQQKELLENYSLEQTQMYDAQILEQMQQYISDYGSANGYDYIFGASNDGSILYAPQVNNITVDVTKYINDSYQGKN